MRTSLRVAIILVIFSGHALAAKGGKKAAPKKPVETMDAGDPVAKEQSEKKVAAEEAETEEERSERERQSDAAEVAKTHARDKVGVFGNILVGFGKAPIPDPTAQDTTGKTTSFTFMAGGHYDVSPAFTLGVRIPWTVGSQTQRDGLSTTVSALGTPELMGEYRVGLSPFSRLPIFFGLGIPIAQGNYDTVKSLRQTYLNDVADAASGYRDPELFGPKRLPIIVGVGIDYDRKAINLHAATKFVAGVKVGGTIPDPVTTAGTYELKSVSFRNVTSAGVAYQFLDKPKLYGALDSWLAYSAINPDEFESNRGASSPTRFQVVFEPRVGARLGKISPSVGYIFPIGGRLADSSISGLELHCDVAF